jgi:hypothetical protein
MKIKYSIITMCSILLFFGCKKGDIQGDFSALGIGSYVTMVALGNTIIDNSNLATAKIDATVREYGTPVSKIKVFVTKGAATTDKTKWKTVKEFTYSGDTKLEITAAEIATALGVPLASLELGAYTLYNQIHSSDGQVHDITNMNSAMYGNPNYNTLMTWIFFVVCPFRATDWGGVGAIISARVLEDGWGDYSPGEIITNIQITSATQLKFNRMWKTDAADTRPVVVNINASTGQATVARQIYGDYAASDYFDVTCISTGINNFVFSCENTITLTLNHQAKCNAPLTSCGANYGTYVLRLQKL